MTILVATDFSGRSDRAVDRALQLCEERGSGVRVIHALNHTEAEEADWGRLNRKMRDSVGETSCETQFAFPEGSPTKAIARDCEETRPDMLLLGPARYNSLGDYFLGTAVDYVLRNTACPVLVVKLRARSPYKHLFAGTDFSAGSAFAIKEAARLFPDATMHIVHGWHVPYSGFQRDAHVRDEWEQNALQQMASFKEDLIGDAPDLASATTLVAQGNALDAIAESIEKQCGDGSESEALVVLGSHGSGGFRQATLGSQTSDMLRYLGNDVLVVNTSSA
ncbi:hypothetical protein HME9302_01321 [Alteripontixanthobacter maritimus]|uniref:UspA domain-containing protein n=1 Tax=Alteripontixanthobacter maritimus TaxID=2161824 RepID=A0A369Q6M2_9SPHN|nr:universal stress protein [Alteripontixanthobacter maritimus]RDC60122.1 hypothetical protein HME9302_01321 [Alteripontixanthobacter maritimus]